MTNFDYRTFKEDLKKRFYWCYSTGEKKYLTEKGYKYLFRCTHFETGNFFWVYDISDALMEDVRAWREEHKKKVSEQVVEQQSHI